MIRLVVFLALMLGGPAAAAAVRVTTGEHDGFTRVVLQFPGAVDWQVGRTEDGYELRVTGDSPAYDLSAAFDRIGRERVASLWADPANGALRLGVGCACHAFPFALRPDVVVIDVQDGPPPPGWGFEAAIGGATLPPLTGRTAPGDSVAVAAAMAPWDWRDIALGNRWGSLGQRDAPAETALLPPLGGRGGLPVAPGAQGAVEMRALQVALAEGMARAATQGLVDPVKRLPAAQSGAQPPPIAQVTLGIGIAARPASAPEPNLSAEGLQCPDEGALAVQDWGDGRPIHEQMADATASLTGEFDRTEPDALARAVKFYLFLGFGAEARALVHAFGGSQAEGPLWSSLSRLVDGETDPGGAFSGLAGCDSPAALWATLADPALPVGEVETRALLRAFSALPPHLRQQLGPGLAERFMAAGDASTAQALSDALLRPAASDADRRTLLMQARLALRAGDTQAADHLLARLLEDPGPLTAQVIGLQIDFAAVTVAPVTQAQVTTIEAMLREADAETRPDLERALVLARALAGDYAAAFQSDMDWPTQADLWCLLSLNGPDDALLAQALGVGADLPADLPAATRLKVAERLLDLGFAEAARQWNGGGDPVVEARAALALGDADGALAALGTASDEAARKVRAEALMQIDAAAAARAFLDLGDAAEAARAARLSGDWTALSGAEDPLWAKVAGSLAAPAMPPAALARSRALVASADDTRLAVEALLLGVPSPEAP